MDLAVKTREKLGKSVNSLRRAGLIPAELYGRGVKNAHLSVSAKDFTKVFKEAGMNTVINLLLEKEKKAAIVHDIDRDYLTGDVRHIDFLEVRLDEKIKAKVPLEFTGEAPAVKEKGGVLTKSMNEVEVEALPQDLPHRLSVDMSVLDDINKSVYVKDLRVPHGVKILISDETVLATITPPAKEEEKVEAPVDLGAVKVESEEKKAERAAEKGETAQVTPPTKAAGAEPAKMEAKPKAEPKKG